MTGPCKTPTVNLALVVHVEGIRVSEVRHRAVFPEESVSVRSPYDLAHVANRESTAGVTLEGPEVRHYAVLPEAGVFHPVARRVTVTDDLTGIVDPIRPSQAAYVTELTQRRH